MQTNRFMVVGESGTGKSEHVKRLIRAYVGRVAHIVIVNDSDQFREFVSVHEEITQERAGKSYDLAAYIRAAGSVLFEVTALDPAPFLERLGDAVMRLGAPVLVVVDEALLFCGPSAPMGWLQLWTGGRKRGVHIIAIGQTLKQSGALGLSKIVLRQSTVYVVFQLSEPNEVKALEEWFPELGEGVRELRPPIDGGAPEYAVKDRRRGTSGVRRRDGWHWLRPPHRQDGTGTGSALEGAN